MKQNRKFSVAFLIGMFMLLFLSLSAFAAETEPKAPDMSVSRNMKTAAENTAAGTGTETEQLGLWGTFNGTEMSYMPGKAEDGVGSALHITGGANGGGGTLALNDSGFSTRTVTHKDASGNTIGTTIGFADASEFVLRVKSTSSFSIQFIAEYRLSPTKELDSKNVSIPSTNGVWKDIVIPFSSFEPTENGKWIYNMKGDYYNGNFNPVIELKITGANFGSSNYATIGQMRVNWYKENMIYDAKIQGQKTSYYQNYDSFDYQTGKITTKRGYPAVDVNNNKVLSGQPSSSLGLSNGNITVQSKAKDGTTKNYNIAVNSTASNNADMVGLTLGIGKLDQVVAPNVTQYTATLPASAGRVKFYPTTYDVNTTISVNGNNPIASGGNSEVIINADTMVIPIVVTAQDGTKKTYTVTTTRGTNNDNNADLFSLTLSKGNLDQVFDPNITTYTATVSNSTTSITVCPVKVDTNSTITVNGAAVNSTANSAAINLTEGENVITVVVTAKNTAITKTYTFTVTRADLSTVNNANLFSVALTAGTFNQKFDKNITEYAATVEGNVSSIKITPTVETNATIKVNGANVNSGSQSGNISLPAGSDTTITVIVTSKDGSTTKTYNFKITRKPVSNDSTLFNLKLSNGKLSPAFDSNTLAYTINVANAVSSIQVTPFKSNSYASIKVNNTAVTSGSTSAAIALAVGNTTINVNVTAQDGTTKTYVLTVTRAAADDTNANLFNVSLSKGILKSDFDPATTTYQAQVSSDIEAITVTPTASDSNATIKVNGIAVTSGSASANISLASGDNSITIEVTAKDGTIKTYTITVTQIVQTDTNADLLSLDVSGGILSPAFSPDITQYTLITPQSTGKVTVTPTKQDANVIIEVLALDDPRVTFKGYNNANLNNNLAITATVLNIPINFPVSIVPFAPPDLTDITVDSPKLTYYINDTFDFATGIIKANYSDKPMEQAALNDKNTVVTGFDASAEAHGQVITVTYGGKTTTYTIDILPFTVPGLTAIKLNGINKLYKVGDSFDWHTGTIIPVISGKDGAAVKLYQRYVKITGFDSSAAVSGQMITLTYAGMTATYEIDIIDSDIPIAYSLGQNMQPGQQPGFWLWSNLQGKYVPGKAEDGIGYAAYITGSGDANMVFIGGDFGAGSVKQPDGTSLTGFKGADAMKLRYSSTQDLKIKFQMEYKVSHLPTKVSGTFTLPSTNGVWQDRIIPFSGFEPTPSATKTFEEQRESIDWLYNGMLGEYHDGDFDPAIELRLSSSVSDQSVSIGKLEFLWNENKAAESIKVENAQTQYHQFEQFNFSKGQIVIHYTDDSTKSILLNDPGAVITGFDSNAAATDQEITVTYAGMTTTYKINVSEGGYDPNPIYTNQQFVTADGFDMYSFNGQSDVVAKVTVQNPDAVTKRTYGTLFAVAYNGKKVVTIKSFEMKDVPKGTETLTLTFTKDELADVTKLKIIALKDATTQQPIFDKALNISKLVF